MFQLITIALISNKIELLYYCVEVIKYIQIKSTMTNLIVNDNYLLKFNNHSCPKNIIKTLSKNYKLIKRNGSKLVFSNGENTFTLWNNQRFHGNYACYITLEKNSNYRITKYELNSKSVYVWIRIYPIELTYLKSYVCITTLEKFLFVIDFYNKINIKKKIQKRATTITRVFQDNYVVRYISEFL
jgi:hypothetical protein